MVLATIFGLEVLGGETGIAVALPDTVGEEAFERNFGAGVIASIASSIACFGAGFEHWSLGRR